MTWDKHKIRGFVHQLLTDVEVKEMVPVGLKMAFDSQRNMVDGAIGLTINSQPFRLIVEAPCNCTQEVAAPANNDEKFHADLAKGHLARAEELLATADYHSAQLAAMEARSQMVLAYLRKKGLTEDEAQASIAGMP